MKHGESGVLDLLFQGNAGKPNILILTEYVNATYFISFDAPLRAMHERGEVNFAVACQAGVEALREGAWTTIGEAFRPDAVVLTRYALPSGVEILRRAKAAGIPVAYHIDDDLLDLPKSLGPEINKRNGSAVVQDARRTMLAEADIVYASTAVLAARMRERFPRQRVFQGIYASYPGDLAPEPSPVGSRGPSVVGYMGSKGHKEDLAIAVPGIARMLRERPDIRFETFGTIEMPSELVSFGNRVTAHAVMKSYSGFLEALAGLQWTIGLAPLADSSFNACKAPTKFVEYTAAGIPVLASDTVVYSGVVGEGGGRLVAEDWATEMASFMDDADARVASVSNARRYCKRVFARARLEEQLRELLRAVGLQVPSPA